MTARPAGPRMYSSHCLHSLRLTGLPAHLSDDVTARVRQLGLRRRGCRCGRWQRSPPVLRPVGNGTYTVASSRTIALHVNNMNSFLSINSFDQPYHY